MPNSVFVRPFQLTTIKGKGLKFLAKEQKWCWQSWFTNFFDNYLLKNFGGSRKFTCWQNWLTNYFVNQLKKNENELMDFDLTKRLTNYFVKRIKKKLGTGTKTWQNWPTYYFDNQIKKKKKKRWAKVQITTN